MGHRKPMDCRSAFSRQKRVAAFVHGAGGRIHREKCRRRDAWARRRESEHLCGSLYWCFAIHWRNQLSKSTERWQLGPIHRSDPGASCSPKLTAMFRIVGLLKLACRALESQSDPACHHMPVIQADERECRKRQGGTAER